MTDNWNALTDDERTKALAENVLGWNKKTSFHAYGHPSHWYDSDNTRIMAATAFSICDTGVGAKDKKAKPFSPLTDLNHTALLWAALSEEQKINVMVELRRAHDHECHTTLSMLSDMLDPLKLSQAIYAVTVGKE